jgi:hypothetical protein
VRLADGAKGGIAAEDGEVEAEDCVRTEEARTWTPPRAAREGAMFREPHAPSRIAGGELTFDAAAHPVRALELRGIAPGGIVWERIVRGLVAVHAEALAGVLIVTGSERELVVKSADVAALERVAALVRLAVSDGAALRQALDEQDVPDDEDDDEDDEDDEEEEEDDAS